MKILILADPSASHTIKWVNSLHKKGIEIMLFGLSEFDRSQYIDGVKIESLKTPAKIKAKLDGSYLKAVYLAAFPKLKKIIKEFNPDILHAHYAASYGFLGALTRFHPFIISVWGIDILTFPKNSLLHRKIIEFSLGKADKVLSTSKFLAKETKKYTSKDITITPFGVDSSLFKPIKGIKSDEVVIGTVKSLERKYGIDYLIESFAELVKKYPDISMKLLIVGGGSLENKFQTMINGLGISGSAEITGHIPYDKIVSYHNKLNIAVYLSVVESFGVSVLESSACGVPVVVSNVGGLPEVVDNEVTGFIVDHNDTQKIISALGKLMLSEELRERFGNAGRERVIKIFNWNKNVDDMVEIYLKTLNGDEVSDT